MGLRPGFIRHYLSYQISTATLYPNELKNERSTTGFRFMVDG
jgi:hypothetical protein